MKKEKKQHHESTIGKIIYGFMLFAPLIAMLTTCMYVIFNKNAYQSYTGTATYEQTHEVQETEEISQTTYYTTKQNYYNGTTFIKVRNLQTSIQNYEKTKPADFTAAYLGVIRTANYNIIMEDFEYEHIKINIGGGGAPYLNTITFTINGTNYQTKAETQNMNTWQQITTPTKNIRYYLYAQNYNTYQVNNVEYSFFYVDANLTGNATTSVEDAITKLTTIREHNVFRQVYAQTTTIRSDLTTAFYNAVNQVEESNLFNWSKNTLIYQGTKATANTLGITNTFIPMLLTYWLIMSVFYFLYDIILMMLNIIHKKIHEVQDNI